MALTEIYVDPSIAADSGAGTIGDPYGDLEYAIEQETFDTTNGTRVNIKAGTEEVLAASLSTAMDDTGTSVAWAPSLTAPLIFQGYTAAAGDGGLGVINGTAVSTPILNETVANIHVINLHIYGSAHGTSGILRLTGGDSSVINCEINGNSSTLGRGIYLGTASQAIGNYIHDIDGTAIDLISGIAAYNTIKNVTIDCTTAIQCAGANCTALRNIISVDGASDGIKVVSDGNAIIGNSIYSNGGTGTGIVSSESSRPLGVFIDNLIEGFSDTGGIGMDLNSTAVAGTAVGGNSIFNCATDYNAPPKGVFTFLSDSAAYEALSSSPFTAPNSDDFSPLDTGSVKEGSVFTFWVV